MFGGVICATAWRRRPFLYLRTGLNRRAMGGATDEFADMGYRRVGFLLAPALGALAALALQGCGGGGGDGPSDTPETPTTGFVVDCVAGERPVADTDVFLERAFPNLSFNSPVALLQAPGDESRWFVVEKGGRVLVFDNAEDASLTQTFIDIGDRVNAGFSESGLLGMAFHPDFKNNRRVIMSYTRSGSPLVSYISRFSSADGGASLDPGSEQVLLTVAQPYSNHNGGQVAFGPDGYLYIGLGDGGSGGDPDGNGQDVNTLLGAMLRIDVDSGTPYAIPNDNPFAQGGGRAEIYAWGLRNPWRWSFDRDTGDLWLGDVGQNQWEEVDRVGLGGNYGWNIREGAHCYGGGSCSTVGLIDPVAEYSHSEGCSVTGGYVYRGTSIPGLNGVYVYGDFCSGRIWGLVEDAQAGLVPELLVDSDFSISAFGQGQDGELYVLHFAADGAIYRLVPQASQSQALSPTALSATGCVDTADPTQPAAKMLAYEINAPFWSDDADKARWFALPDDTAIHIDANEDWELPIGSVTMKHFRVGGRLIETRLYMRHTDGSWAGYSYEWNDAQTDASLVIGGKSRDLGAQIWHYPSSAQCMECHTVAAGRSLGLETAQLNRDVADGAGSTVNQLSALEQRGLLDAPLADDPVNLPALTEPADTGASLADRSRAYLHTNCAQCHRPGGPTPANIDVRYDTPMVDMGICDVLPEQGDLGVASARIVAPGDPASSILSLRMQRRDVHAMPPLGSELVDADGVQLMIDWITAMDAACS